MNTVNTLIEMSKRVNSVSACGKQFADIAASFKTEKRTEEAFSYLEKKGLISEFVASVEAAIAKEAAVSNRTKHTFSTLKELNEFMSANNCGEYWNDENKTFSVYKYN